MMPYQYLRQINYVPDAVNLSESDNHEVSQEISAFSWT
jgi:hypothetical protein